MIKINPLTTDVTAFANALSGQWDFKYGSNGDAKATWCIVGHVVFLEGDKELFPYDVLAWHGEGSGWWGILGKVKQDQRGGRDNG